MTKHQPDSTNPSGYEPDEILITPEMVEAGLVELRDHPLAGDAEYALECAYRAMEYARREAM